MRGLLYWMKPSFCVFIPRQTWFQSQRVFAPRVRPQLRFDLDGAIAICPSPVPQEVEKRWVMMGTDARDGGCESPGQIAFSQVEGISRQGTVPAFQAGNASSNLVGTASYKARSN